MLCVVGCQAGPILFVSVKTGTKETPSNSSKESQQCTRLYTAGVANLSSIGID